MARIYNFSAGPAVLPEEVLKEAAAEMLDYKGSGMSVMGVEPAVLLTTVLKRILCLHWNRNTVTG